MASNLHFSGGAVTNAGYNFPTPVEILHISVAAGVVFSISLDGGKNYITVTPGLHNLSVGNLTNLKITSTGDWSVLGAE